MMHYSQSVESSIKFAASAQRASCRLEYISFSTDVLVTNVCVTEEIQKGRNLSCAQYEPFPRKLPPRRRRRLLALATRESQQYELDLNRTIFGISFGSCICSTDMYACRTVFSFHQASDSVSTILRASLRHRLCLPEPLPGPTEIMKRSRVNYVPTSQSL